MLTNFIAVYLKTFNVSSFSSFFPLPAISLSSSHATGRSLSPGSRHPMYLGSLLDDQHWHHVAVEHHSNHLNLTVDKSTMWVQIPSRFMHWDHDQVCLPVCVCGMHRNRKTPTCFHTYSFFYKMFVYVCQSAHVFAQMSVGADQGLGSLRSDGLNRNFHGCLENLVYNGLNLVDLAKQKDQRVTVKVNCLTVCYWKVCVCIWVCFRTLAELLLMLVDATGIRTVGATRISNLSVGSKRKIRKNVGIRNDLNMHVDTDGRSLPHIKVAIQ